MAERNTVMTKIKDFIRNNWLGLAFLIITSSSFIWWLTIIIREDPILATISIGLALILLCIGEERRHAILRCAKRLASVTFKAFKFILRTKRVAKLIDRIIKFFKK